MAIVGPIALFNNFPINADYYQPSQFYISNIAKGSTTTITTTVNNNYVVGQLVRLVIPPYNGIRELNEMQGYVISLPSADEVEVDIDSSAFTPFVTSSQPNQPQILAIGDTNAGAINQTPQQQTTYISGSFINISPI